MPSIDSVACQTRSMNALGYIGAIISVVAGVLGFVWPQKVSAVIGLRLPGLLGVSEFRATYGGLFIGGGIAVLVLQSDDAAAVLGSGWGGAFVARAISLVIDKSRSKENIAGLVIEAVVASLLLLA
ncbi:MAG: hypothetical protein B7C54_03635 [Acidimicrobiales bacterium mtb01]|nr:DUF4345 domain-containing protein [Actinomycetota bacterium]TEX47382.1 MAG: hypothetical protein B7C54_03635 [Acidimicrobiales bacterium mtb01]